MKIMRHAYFSLLAVLLTCVSILGWKFVTLSDRIKELEESAAQEWHVPIRCEEPACPVSMIDLVAHPYRYDGRRIRVVGSYCLGFELSALFPLRPEGYLLREESVWIADAGPDIPDLENGCRPVIMVGIFKAGRSGHLGKNFGELTNVITDLYPDR